MIFTLLNEAAKAQGCSRHQLIGCRRKSEIVQGRLIFTALAIHYNYRHYEIAWVLNKTLAAANYYVKRAKESMVIPYFKEKVESVIKKIDYGQEERI